MDTNSLQTQYQSSPQYTQVYCSDMLVVIPLRPLKDLNYIFRKRVRRLSHEPHRRHTGFKAKLSQVGWAEGALRAHDAVDGGANGERMRPFSSRARPLLRPRSRRRGFEARDETSRGGLRSSFPRAALVGGGGQDQNSRSWDAGMGTLLLAREGVR